MESNDIRTRRNVDLETGVLRLVFCAGRENRTPVYCLEGSHSATKLYPQLFFCTICKFDSHFTGESVLTEPVHSLDLFFFLGKLGIEKLSMSLARLPRSYLAGSPSRRSLPSDAWEASILPLNYTRDSSLYYTKERICSKQPLKTSSLPSPKEILPHHNLLLPLQNSHHPR